MSSSEAAKGYAKRLLQSSKGDGLSVLTTGQAYFLAEHAEEMSDGDGYIDGLVARRLNRNDATGIIGAIKGPPKK
jgi:hypothetical protein